jgi:3-oxoadipate enol-lactonase
MPCISREGVSIYYELMEAEEARGTIAFLNGVMASTNSWAFYINPLRKAGYNILLHDFRGQLASDKPEGPYSFSQHIEDFRYLLDHLELGQVHLAGTSYGGEIAMRAAIDMPERILSITVIDSVSELDPLVESFVGSWMASAGSGDPEVFYWGMVPSIYSRRFLSSQWDNLSARAQQVRKLPPEFFRGQIELYKAFLQDVTMTQELDSVQCPALIICGEEDILKPPKFSRIIADSIPDSRFVLLPRTGHVAIFEEPALILSLIRGFLQELS